VARPWLWIRLVVAVALAIAVALLLALATHPPQNPQLSAATAQPPLPTAPPRPHPPPPVGAPRIVRTFLLEREPPREQELPAGTSDSYEIDLDAGQYLHVDFEQHGVDVAIDVFPPGRPSLFRADSPTGKQGPEDVYLLADRPGRYRLVVVAVKPGAHGRYLARLVARRPASLADQDRAAAQLAAAEAKGLAPSPRSFWEAAAKYERALRLWQGLGDLRPQAWALHSLGRLYFENGRSGDSLAVFLRYLAVSRALHAFFDEAVALNGMGRAFDQLGDFDQARTSYAKALAIWRSHQEFAAEVTTSINLGILFQNHSKPWEALNCFRGARDLAQKAKIPKSEINALNGMGWVYASAGDWQRARDAREQALGLVNQIDDKQLKIITLRQLGDAHLAAAEPEQALLYLRRALGLLDDPEAASDRALILNSMGLCLQREGEYEQAQDAFRKALAVFEQQSNMTAATDARINLGRTYVRLHQPEQALTQYALALEQARRGRDRTLEGVARFGMAMAERDRGNLILALSHGEAALQIVESLRAEALRPDLQRSYLAWHETYFDLLVDTLMARHRQQPGSGFARKAFERSEQARGRQLLDALAAQHEVQAGRAAAGPSLQARRDRLTAEISVQDRARKQPGVSPADAAAAQRKLIDLLDQLNELDAEARRGAPGFAGRAAAAPGLDSQIASLLDPRTILLEYYLQEPQSFLWVISSAGRIQSYELPGRSEIEARVRSLVGLLSGTDRRCWTLPDGGREAAERESVELSRILLGQVGAILDGQRLAVAASGALQYLPFAALPDPRSRESPLVLRHEIVYIPSLAVLAALRERAAARQPPTGLLAIIADPVFGLSDPRLHGTAAWKPKQAPGELSRLSQSRAEANAILALVPDARVLLKTGFEANPELVTSGALAAYRILHFATHGTDQADQPEMSAIVLSSFDRLGNPRDGYLRAKDVAGLEIGADLVVLSACSTALGPEIDREGMFGLAQGFLAAGARQVLVSLWNVGDVSTAELMQRFYRHLFDQRQPLSASEALRLAQQEMSRQPRWRTPDHWAGFVLQGDWR
jgi:CHAT domain-containing protein/tetratricopeptide (TPR) repeat protein